MGSAFLLPQLVTAKKKKTDSNLSEMYDHNLNISPMMPPFFQ